MLKKISHKLYTLLRWSEKYTKTDMVYLAKGGFWLTLGQIATTLIGFGLAIAFAYYLPKDIYGQYKYVLSVFGILTIATLPGMDTAVIRSVAMGYEGSFFSALKNKIKWGIVGSLGALLVATYYFIQNNNYLALSFLVVAIFTPLTDSLALCQSYFNGAKRFDKLTKHMTIVRLVSGLSTLITIYFTDNIFWILISFFAPLVIVRYIYLIIIKIKYKPNDKTDDQVIKYGQHLSLLNIITTVGNQLDKILIFQFIGAQELAVYSLAMAPLEQIKSLLKPLNTLALPKFANKNLAEIKTNIFKKTALLTLMLLVVAVVYIIVAPLLFKLAFPKYIEAIPYTQILAISILSFPVFALLSIFEGQKMIKEIYKFRITSGLVQIVITFLLIFYFGFMGAILSRIIIRFFNLIFSLLLLKKSSNTNPADSLSA